MAETNTIRIPADREHLLAVAIQNAWNGDFSLIDRLRAEIATDPFSAEGIGGGGEKGKTGACLTAPDHSASPSPTVSALTGECSSRGDVDFDELDRLFALMPEGPWHPLRTGDSHEIRQIDTDPTNKHHWPFRLCQSISGQRAACDDAVFAFIAGVLNAWPTISAANSDDAFIERTLVMPEDELRKRFLIDGKCPEQAADAARQSLRIAELKVALMQISSQYVVNRHDMTDAEALGAIKRIADKALAGEARRAETEGLGSRASDGEAGTPQATTLFSNPAAVLREPGKGDLALDWKLSEGAREQIAEIDRHILREPGKGGRS